MKYYYKGGGVLKQHLKCCTRSEIKKVSSNSDT